MRRKMVPRVSDNNPLGTQNTISLDFEEYTEGRQKNFKFHPNQFMIWLKFRPDGVKYYSIDQSKMHQQRSNKRVGDLDCHDVHSYMTSQGLQQNNSGGR